MNRNLNKMNLTLQLIKHTARRILKRRSTWLMLFLGLLPCSVMLFWISLRFVDNANVMKPYEMFRLTLSYYYLFFYVPLLAVFLGLGTISEEIETKNITFLLVRPLPRWCISLGRLLGYLVAAVILTSLSVTACYFANMLFQIEALFSQIGILINAVWVLCYGLLAYLSVVALLGTVMKKYSVLIAVVWAAFDTFFSLIPIPAFNNISIKHYMQTGFTEVLPQFGISINVIDSTSPFVNALICLIYAAIAWLLINIRLTYFEIVLSDDSN